MTTEETNLREFEEWARDKMIPEMAMKYAQAAWQAAQKGLTEQRDNAFKMSASNCDLAHELAIRLATVTEQRDRLAEALRQMWPFIEEDDYPNCNTPAFNAAILKYKQALQSLTQPKKYDANEHQSFYP